MDKVKFIYDKIRNYADDEVIDALCDIRNELSVLEMYRTSTTIQNEIIGILKKNYMVNNFGELVPIDNELDAEGEELLNKVKEFFKR